MQLELKLGKEFDQINVYLIRNENTKAIQLLNNIIDKEPINDSAWLLLGIAKRRIGLLDEAIKCFKIATELNIHCEEGWGLYTVTLMERGKRSDAEEAINKAATLNPDNEKIQFYKENLIRIYEKFGPFF
jgi:tetratricopeptide (TPR) repeat protein